MVQANDVQLVAGNAPSTMANLNYAINLSGTVGAHYYAGTAASSVATSTAPTVTTVVLTAITPGTGGNSLTLSETSAQLSATAFTGGVALNAGGGAGVATAPTNLLYLYRAETSLIRGALLVNGGASGSGGGGAGGATGVTSAGSGGGGGGAGGGGGGWLYCVFESLTGATATNMIDLSGGAGANGGNGFGTGTGGGAGSGANGGRATIILLGSDAVTKFDGTASAGTVGTAAAGTTGGAGGAGFTAQNSL